MVTIDPRTLAVGPGGGRGVLFVLCAMVLGLAASGWIASLDCGSDRDTEDFVCVEDERGGGCPPLTVELREGQFDDQQANAPSDDNLGDDNLGDETTAGNDAEMALDDVDDLEDIGEAGLTPPPRLTGMIACVFHEPARARAAWDQLGESDRLLLQSFCRKNAIVLP